MACAACAVSASAQYSQNPAADYMQVNVKGWLFCPVTDATEVRGFLAYLYDEEATGSNVELVWYQREADDSWTTWGWADKDLGAAVWWLRGALSDPTAFSRDGELSAAAELVGPAGSVAPKSMQNGLFFDDPLQPSIQQASDPETVVSVLSAFGWPVAPSMSEIAVSEDMQCGPVSMEPVLYLMRDLTSRVETAYFAESTITDPCAWPCTCTTTWSAPYGCGAWIFDYSSPGIGGGLVCHYHRMCSRDWSKAGETWFWCNDCTDPGGTKRFRELGDNDAEPGNPCTPPPW